MLGKFQIYKLWQNVMSDAYIYTYRNTANTKKSIKTVYSKLRNLNQGSNQVHLRDFFSQNNMKVYNV